MRSTWQVGSVLEQKTFTFQNGLLGLTAVVTHLPSLPLFLLLKRASPGVLWNSLKNGLKRKRIFILAVFPAHAYEELLLPNLFTADTHSLLSRVG